MLTSLVCLALTVFHEARGEPELGKIAVAQVVINRAHIRDKPICAVLREKGQFSWNVQKYVKSVKKHGKIRYFAVKTLLPEGKSGWKQSVLAAEKALKQQNSMKNIEFFHATYVRPPWSRYLIRVFRAGNHIFYARKPRSIST